MFCMANLHRPKVFLSYARNDADVVERVVEDLRGRGADILIDVKGLKVGDSITEFVESSIRVCDFVCLALSTTSLERPWVLREYRSALALQLSTRRLRILPLLLDECDLPMLLRDIKYADFSKSYQIGLNDLLHAIGLSYHRSPLTELVELLPEFEKRRSSLMKLDDAWQLMEKLKRVISACLEELRMLPKNSLHLGPSEGQLGLVLSDAVTFEENYLGDDWDDAPILNWTESGVEQYFLTLRQYAQEIRERKLYVLPHRIDVIFSLAGEFPREDETIDVRSGLQHILRD